MKFRFFMPAALLAVAVAGCDRTLTTSPGDRVPADQLIVDGPTALAALEGAYDGMQSGSYYGLDVELLGDMPADNSEAAGTYQFLKEVTQNKINADNPEVTAMWTAIYDQLYRDNVIISRVPALTTIDDDTKNSVLGEAYFLRALAFHNLVKFWGDVPMPLAPAAVADDAAAYTRAPVLDVYAQILSDLDKAASMITNTGDTRRATPTAVEAIRARVLFYRASVAGADAAADYQGALNAANSVLSGRDTLTVPFGNLFTPLGADTEEDIFRVSFTAAEYNSLGYYWLYDGRQEARPTENLYDAFDPADLRLAHTIAEDDGDLDAIKWPTTIGAEHPHVIRLAELVLIKAEVLARQNQLPAAVAEYNKVRIRAGLPKHVFGVDVTSQAEVMAEILLQRRLEFAFEGDRWPDLVRLGLAVSVKGIQDRSYQTLFPIPLRETTTAPLVTQNPGYGPATPP